MHKLVEKREFHSAPMRLRFGPVSTNIAIFVLESNALSVPFAESVASSVYAAEWI